MSSAFSGRVQIQRFYLQSHVSTCLKRWPGLSHYSEYLSSFRHLGRGILLVGAECGRVDLNLRIRNDCLHQVARRFPPGCYVESRNPNVGPLDSANMIAPKSLNGTAEDDAEDPFWGHNPGVFRCRQGLPKSPGAMMKAPQTQASSE